MITVMFQNDQKHCPVVPVAFVPTGSQIAQPGGGANGLAVFPVPCMGEFCMWFNEETRKCSKAPEGGALARPPISPAIQ